MNGTNNYTVGDKISNFFLTGHPNHNFTEKPMVVTNEGDIQTLKKPKDTFLLSVDKDKRLIK